MPTTERDPRDGTSQAVRRRLEEELERTEHRLRALRAEQAAAEPLRAADDELDLAMELAERAARGDELERLQAATRRLRLALRRLQGGQPPRCEDCDGAIPAARLLAVPGTTTCRDCQARRERHEGQTARARRACVQHPGPGAARNGPPRYPIGK